MKEIKYYIESNKKLKEQYEKELNETKVESERLRIKNNIDKIDYYIRGLQDAIKYIENEKEVNNNDNL